MKLNVFLSIGLLSLVGCTQMRYAQTSVGQFFYNSQTVPFNGGEVICGDGRVCGEVEVVRVDIEPANKGRIDVTLHNRTGDKVAVQVAIEILAANGSRLDYTTFQNVPLQPRQETVWSMPGIYREGAGVKVVLRAL